MEGVADYVVHVFGKVGELWLTRPHHRLNILLDLIFYQRLYRSMPQKSEFIQRLDILRHRASPISHVNIVIFYSAILPRRRKLYMRPVR